MKLLFLLSLAALVLAHSAPAFALADPDTIQIESVTRYDDTAIAGDAFILVEYTLLYGSLPTETISQGWLGRLVDSGGLGQLASVQPYSGGDIPDLGYSRGAYGFYFTEEPELTGALRVTLEGNPSLSPTPSGIFLESIIQRNASDLAPDLRAMALRFEDIWDIDLVSPVSGGVNRFTVEGEEYFASALPNLRKVAPDMFTTSQGAFPTVDREFDTTYTDAREALFDDTPVATGLESLADTLNVSEGVARFTLVLLLAVLAAFWVGRVPGLDGIGFTSTLQIWAVYIVMMGGFWLGMVNAPTLGIMTVLALMSTAVVFFLQRTGA